MSVGYRMLILAAVALCGVVMATATTESVTDLGPAVTTTNGPVTGLLDSKLNVLAWKGIPYAASTAGQNRFRPPQPVAPWTAQRDATKWGPGCVQYVTNADAPKLQSEDCLHVNVWAPVAADNLPVMVWFYGGGFKEGSNIGPYEIYDGKYMAGRGKVVVVGVNYRLGALGFLVTGNGDINGNMGFLDQQMALKWVRSNIVRFGGNPNAVTVFGESAGAMSIGLHMISPGSKGLFHRAIQQSNPLAITYKRPNEQAIVGRNMCKRVGCDKCNLNCLRSASLPALMQASKEAQGSTLVTIESNYRHLLGGALQWTPTVDGTIIPSQVLPALQRGGSAIVNNVPLIIGSNANEGTTFVYAAISKKIPMLLSDAALFILWPSRTRELMGLYKQASDTDGRQPFSRLATDYLFQCPLEEFAINARKSNLVAYVYNYRHIFSYPALFKGLIPDECSTQTCHAAELPIIFHNGATLPTGQVQPLSPEENKLSDSIVDYWTNFAKTGNPNGNGLPNWPVFDVAKRNVLVLGQAGASGLVVNNNKCLLWEKYGWRAADGSTGPTVTRFAQLFDDLEGEDVVADGEAEAEEESDEVETEDENETEEDAEDEVEAEDESAEEEGVEAEESAEQEAEGAEAEEEAETAEDF